MNEKNYAKNIGKQQRWENHGKGQKQTIEEKNGSGK